MDFYKITSETPKYRIVKLKLGRITLGQGTMALRLMAEDLKKLGYFDRDVAINFSEINYVDSSGLGELHSFYVMLNEAGRQLYLDNPSKKIRELLVITKFNNIIKTRDYFDPESLH